MVLDGLSEGDGKTVTRWKRLLGWLADGGGHIDVTASQLFRARNTWVKEQSFGNDPGPVTISHFRQTAHLGLLRVLKGEKVPGSKDVEGERSV